MKVHVGSECMSITVSLRLLYRDAGLDTVVVRTSLFIPGIKHWTSCFLSCWPHWTELEVIHYVY